MRTLYVDILFLINFCMDFLALRFCGSLLHIKRGNFRLIAAAGLGAIYAVLSVLFPGDALLSLLISVLVAFLLCYVGYLGEVSGRRYLFLCVLFYTVSLLFGGMITAFYEFLSRFLKEGTPLSEALSGRQGKAAVFFLLALASALIIRAVNRAFSFHRSLQSIALSVYAGGKLVKIHALVDTGSSLCDPISGRQGIVVNPRAVEGILPHDILTLAENGGLDPSGLCIESRRRVRLIPTESLGGNRLLIGYLPDRIELRPEEKDTYIADAVLVLDSGKRRDYNGFDAIIPFALVA